MLALTRKKNESIIIDGQIEITVLDVQGDKVRIGINAPKEVEVYRKEIYDQISKSNREASFAKIDAISKLNTMIKNREKI